ncbi:MAG: aspartate 1-decarboxylase [Ignavibacteria bacterium]|nr:aspartate 1-decarboxylase [Ignavibacteria bacterium]
MKITMLKSKIHKATVTMAELHYEGSLTLDAELMEAAGMHPYEKVHVVNFNNGERFETYLIEGERNSGIVCLNGPSSRLGQVGDEIIVMAYGVFEYSELNGYKPKKILVDKKNRIIK